MKVVTLSIIIAGALIAGALYFSSRDSSGDSSEPVVENNVSIVDGVQIVELEAKGGYWPRRSTAKAGVPTTLRFNTKGTFDCSSYIRIPSLNIARSLPQTGQTDIDLGIQKEGIFRGSCGMGMYPFEIEFRS